MEFSELEAEWHPTLNLPLAFNETLPTSRKYWWLGSCDHQWQAPLRKRQQGSKCPYCSNKSVLVGFNDLATTRPAIAAEWHPTKNDNLSPQQVTFGSRKKIWWRGACGHEWEMALTERTTRGAGCHYCSGHRVLRGFNDFASQSPDLLLQWHPTKNIILSHEVSKKNKKKAWWLGECGHEWDSTILSRVNGAGCPFCSGNKILEGFNDLLTLESVIATEWHPIKNGELKPSAFGRGSKEKVWWLGSGCGHEWQSPIGDRVFKKTGCHLCSGKVIIFGENDLFTLYPNLAKEIHPTKNLPDLDISNERLNSLKKVWWLGACGHEFESSIRSRTNPKTDGSGCHYCGGNKVLEGFNDLASQNPELASEWHPTKNGDLTPRAINAKSGKKYWWLGKCGHEWESQLSNRDSSGAGCNVCAGKTVLAGFNDLASKMPSLVSEWHPTKNGDLRPTQVTVSANMKIWWMCCEGHEWESRPNSRAKGAGCPTCAIGKQVSKAEKSLHDFVASLGIQFETSNRTVLKGKEIDLWIPAHNVGIEFNGTYWHREKHRGKDLHHNKYLAAQKAGIQLIQIWEDDWNQKPELIKSILKQKLGVAEKVLAEETDVIPVTTNQAEEFLSENHLQGSASGKYYLGLVSKGDIETLRAVMVLEEEPGNILNIIRYATSANVVDGFTKLLSHATKSFKPDSFTVIADNCEANAELYENNGFIVEEVLPPDYLYVVRNERKDRANYPLERFRGDPKLLWEEGLTEMELADLNGLDRIWDAGKTRYRLIVGE